MKKVWHKLQAAQNEIRDLREESQKAREDMLDTIRESTKVLKLKQLLLDNFVPREELERVRVWGTLWLLGGGRVGHRGYCGWRLCPFPCRAPSVSPHPHPHSQLEARAVWDDEADEWALHRIELAGNRLRVRRPPSMLSASYTALFAALPMPQARPVSQHALARAHIDSDPRFRSDNIASMDLEFSNFGAPPADKLRVVANTRAVEAVGASGGAARSGV